MTTRKLTILIFGSLALLIGFVVFAILARDSLKDYGPVVTSISTFMIFLVNIIVITINMLNLDYNQKPLVIVSFQLNKEGSRGSFYFDNIGNSAAIIKSIIIDPKWLEEFFSFFPTITEEEKKFLRELKRTHIVIPPKESITIKPYIESQSIVDSQLNNKVEIRLLYENISKRKFEKVLSFDFAQYNNMINYDPD